MSQQLKGAMITGAVGFMLVGAEFAFQVHTSLAGLFILGMGSGLLLGDRMGKKPAPPTSPMQPL